MEEGSEDPPSFLSSLVILFYRNGQLYFLFAIWIENTVMQERVVNSFKWSTLWRIFSMDKGQHIINIDEGWHENHTRRSIHCPFHLTIFLRILSWWRGWWALSFAMPPSRHYFISRVNKSFIFLIIIGNTIMEEREATASMWLSLLNTFSSRKSQQILNLDEGWP